VRSRLEGILLTATIACAAAWADGPPVTPVAAAPGPVAPSPQEVRAAVATLRTDPNLGGEKKIKSLHWTTSSEKESDPTPVPNWFLGFLEFLSRFSSLLLWAAGAVLVAISIVWIGRALSTRVSAAPIPSPKVSRVRGMDISPESLPADIGAAALSLLEAGRNRDALSLLYRGALSRAVHRYGVTIGESYTEGEALRAVNGTLDPPRAAYIADLIATWQRAVYAGEAVMHDSVARLCRTFMPTLDGAAA
jgi:Domain of unknown function (DUF4129)